jgi:hypothetical protein
MTPTLDSFLESLGGAGWVTPEGDVLTVDADTDHARVALHHGVFRGLEFPPNTDPRLTALAAGWIRYRFHTDPRKHSPRAEEIIRRTCSFNVRNPADLAPYLPKLVSSGIIPERMTVVIGDETDERVLFRGPAIEAGEFCKLAAETARA